MPAAIKNILRDKGETVPMVLVYRQGASLPPVDLTGCAAALTLLDRIGDAPVVLDSTNGGITLGTTDGRIQINLDLASYTALAEGQYAYELSVTFASGKKKVLANGKWTIR